MNSAKCSWKEMKDPAGKDGKISKLEGAVCCMKWTKE